MPSPFPRARYWFASAVVAGLLAATAACSNLSGPDGPDVTASLETPPATVAVHALRVAVGSTLTELVPPPVGSPRTEQAVHGAVFGTQLVQVALVGVSGDTLAAAAFSQDYRRDVRYWVAGRVGRSRPMGICVGTIAAVPLRAGTGDSLFVMYGGLPNGAIC